MVGACNEAEAPPSSILSNKMSCYSSRDRRFSKQVHDNVHGNIYLDPLALKFVVTEQFQRLRDLKQLGLAYMVYPGVVHSRFEHSLGVYWLDGNTVEKIQDNQGLELGIDSFDIQTLKLSGLLHDVGHGPYSHVFEREFLPRVIDGYTCSHEEMSVKMVDYIVDEHSIDINPDSLKRVKEMILASSHSVRKSAQEKQFLYDIVANGRTGIDVDKFDYIVRDTRACGLGCSFQFERLTETMRVIGDEICYCAKDYLTINKLFTTRADLHRTVYTHSIVKFGLCLHLLRVDMRSSFWQCRFLGEVPLLPDSALKLLEDLCCSEGVDNLEKDVRDGDRVTQGLSDVWILILGRPLIRKACLTIAFNCFVHPQDDVRAKAIRVCDKYAVLSQVGSTELKLEDNVSLTFFRGPFGFHQMFKCHLNILNAQLATCHQILRTMEENGFPVTLCQLVERALTNGGDEILEVADQDMSFNMSSKRGEDKLINFVLKDYYQHLVN
ncbi:hypothetical protein MKW94_018052 [Papaver nudicaule]|uniref:HD domain-containing protein n=1 Tax=Papaver nudicaule TaxID=74823 RepID=A0AA41SLU8_PAPNU|nr:hypothetical protein [Papaver nudicaule]MCL7037260.1 hypothetical protein [Papaver nudicaule]